MSWRCRLETTQSFGQGSLRSLVNYIWDQFHELITDWLMFILFRWNPCYPRQGTSFFSRRELYTLRNYTMRLWTTFCTLHAAVRCITLWTWKFNYRSATENAETGTSDFNVAPAKQRVPLTPPLFRRRSCRQAFNIYGPRVDLLILDRSVNYLEVIGSSKPPLTVGAVWLNLHPVISMAKEFSLDIVFTHHLSNHCEKRRHDPLWSSRQYC